MDRSALGKDMHRTEAKISQRWELLESYIYRDMVPLTDLRFRAGLLDGAGHPDWDDSDWERIGPGFIWGEPNSFGWFRIRVRIPEAWAGQRVAVDIQPGGLGSGGFEAECLAYLDGEPKQGIDRNHHLILLATEADANREYLLAVEAFTGTRLAGHRFDHAHLVTIDEPTLDLYWDLRVTHETLLTMAPHSLVRHRLLALVNETVNLLDLSFADVPLSAGQSSDAYAGEAKYPGSSSFYRSVREASDYFRTGLAGVPAPEERERITMAGHAHIDVGWLWTVWQSRKKVGRTFSTVLELMDRYPDYHYFQSQPVLYKFAQEDYPELYARLRERVQEGRWEANGATWVEMDTNIPCGESLVRQFLFGKRFFMREFGYDARVLWLPDVFGYSWALPQIMRKSGVDYFMTTKISWNEYNEIPFDIFTWRGVDGSDVLTQFITTVSRSYFYTYNGELAPAEVRTAWTNFKGQDKTDEVMLSFGYGDGGGGPTEEMLENASRLQRMPDYPLARQGRIDACFDRIAAKAHDLHLWNGELYFEYHRGTYTTQARTKRGNRACETLLQDTEFLCSLSWLDGQPYPAEEINASWEMLLTNQFHDILPGSSIREVYEVAEGDYRQIQQRMQPLRDRAMRAMAQRISGDTSGIAVYNTLSWERDDVLVVPRVEGGFADADGSCPVQDVVSLSGEEQTLVRVRGVPSKGCRLLEQTETRPSPASGSLFASERLMENDHFRLELDEQAEIVSLYDKRQDRQVLAPDARANRLLLFEDRPLRFDAWNIDLFYVEKEKAVTDLESVVVVEEGPVRASIEIRRAFGRSTLRQRISLYEGLPRIDFETEVDWQERLCMLKVAFPVDIRSDQASYEIQFGAINRPTHWNTSWDWAKFEVCAQRWADLSEGDYGVSLLNDCKYGYDIKDNVIRLTLLRGPVTPDSRADLGRHTFTYSLYPHAGDWAWGGTPRAAMALNRPLLQVPWEPSGDEGVAATPFVTVDREDVVVETIKKAEDRDELVLRLYENANRRGAATLTFDRPLAEVYELDLLENRLDRIMPNGDSVRVQIKPYEILTLGLTFA